MTGKAKPEATAKGTRLEAPEGRKEPEPEAVRSPCLEPEAGRGRPPELHEMHCNSQTRERTLVESSPQARKHRSPPSAFLGGGAGMPGGADDAYEAAAMSSNPGA